VADGWVGAEGGEREILESEAHSRTQLGHRVTECDRLRKTGCVLSSR